MFSLLLAFSLANLVLGYYLGTMLLRRVPARAMLLVSGGAVLPVGEPLAEQSIDSAVCEVVLPDEHLKNAAISATSVASGNANERSSNVWKSACLDIRQDISNIRDRIQYALQANDKLLNKELAFGVQCRSPAWQQLLHDKVTALEAELAADPAANVDCVAPEMCLSQIETLQTNLKLLDWSESSESILRKIEREVEAVKSLLPKGM